MGALLDVSNEHLCQPTRVRSTRREAAEMKFKYHMFQIRTPNDYRRRRSVVSVEATTRLPRISDRRPYRPVFVVSALAPQTVCDAERLIATNHSMRGNCFLLWAR